MTPAKTDPAPPTADRRPPRGDAAAAVRLSFGPVDVVVRSAMPLALDEILQIYPQAALLPAQSPAEEPPPDAAISVYRARSRYTAGRRFRVAGLDGPFFSVRKTAELLPHIEWGINWEVVKRVNRFVQLHAGVVANAGATAIMAGNPGSGKTTLTAALSARGAEYLSDEFALLDPETGLLRPFPRAMCIKEGSFEVVKRLGLPLYSARRYRKGPKGRVAYVRPIDIPNVASAESYPPRIVLFPKYTEGQAPHAEPISRAEAIFELQKLCFNAGVVPSRGLPVLTKALSNAACYRLTAGPADDTADLVLNLLAAAAPSRNAAPEAPAPLRSKPPALRIPERLAAPQPALPTAISTDTASENPAELTAAILRTAFCKPLPAKDLLDPPAVLDDEVAKFACEQGLAALTLTAAEKLGLQVTPPAQARLVRAADVIASGNALLAHHTRRLAVAFNERDVSALFLKGLAVGVELYGGIDHRPAGDIDVLIRPEHVEVATEALRNLGAENEAVPLCPDFFPRFHYETGFILPGSPPAKVDLHVRPLRPAFCRNVTAASMWPGARRIDVAGAEITVPAPELMLAYLAAHAAFHGANRLIWLLDLHRLASGCIQPLDWERFNVVVEEWNIAWPAKMALERCEAAFGQVVPGRALQRITDKSNWKQRLATLQAPHDAQLGLARLAVDCLVGGVSTEQFAYLYRVIFPHADHMGGIYPYRHLGWLPCSHVYRWVRGLRAAVPFRRPPATLA